MTRKYSSELYPREAVIKAAYAMIDRYYVHLDYLDSQYIMELLPKEQEVCEEDTEKLLDNEMIYQLARYTVSERTADVRKIILARAFSSAMVSKSPVAYTVTDAPSGQSIVAVLSVSPHTEQTPS